MKNNKSLRNTIKILLLIVIGAVTACNKIPKCEEPANVMSTAFTIDFLSVSTNKYVYAPFGYPSVLNKDSLRLTDKNGNAVPFTFYEQSDRQKPLIKYYQINLDYFISNNEFDTSFTKEVSKSVYIQLAYNQYDTINYRFKCKKNECADEFEYMRVYHKGALLKEFDRNNSVQITINRP